MARKMLTALGSWAFSVADPKLQNAPPVFFALYDIPNYMRDELCWLPLQRRIQLNILMLMYNCLLHPRFVFQCYPHLAAELFVTQAHLVVPLFHTSPVQRGSSMDMAPKHSAITSFWCPYKYIFVNTH